MKFKIGDRVAINTVDPTINTFGVVDRVMMDMQPYPYKVRWDKHLGWFEEKDLTLRKEYNIHKLLSKIDGSIT